MNSYLIKPSAQLPSDEAALVQKGLQSYVSVHQIKGRGAASQLAHRFEKDSRDAFDDGWGTLTDAHDQGQPWRTEVFSETAKSILSSNDSPDIPFTTSLNPYRGCEHGCIYCYARPSHSYLGFSPGLDFETKIVAKHNTVELLRKALSSSRYVPTPIAIGTVTDCYQPVERTLQLTRGVLELLHECHHPCAIVTKSATVERDIDLLAPMAQQGLVVVYITITTLDAALARILEPRAAAPYRRLRTIQALAQAGIPVGVSVSPQIPFLNEDMEQVLAAAWEAGARSAFYQVLRLPWELSPLFRQWLELHFPDRAKRVMARLQDMRGGKDYDADFATRMKGQGLWAQLIQQRFQKAASRYGYNQSRQALNVAGFVPPCTPRQGRLF